MSEASETVPQPPLVEVSVVGIDDIKTTVMNRRKEQVLLTFANRVQVVIHLDEVYWLRNLLKNVCYEIEADGKDETHAIEQYHWLQDRY